MKYKMYGMCEAFDKILHVMEVFLHSSSAVHWSKYVLKVEI